MSSLFVGYVSFSEAGDSSDISHVTYVTFYERLECDTEGVLRDKTILMMKCVKKFRTPLARDDVGN